MIHLFALSLTRSFSRKAEKFSYVFKRYRGYTKRPVLRDGLIRFVRINYFAQNIYFFITVSWRVSLLKSRKIKPGFREAQGHVTFVSNHASSFTKIRSRWIIVKGRFLSFKTLCFFRILIFCCNFTFILIVVVVIELVFVPFQQPRHCLLVYFWGSHKSRSFCYPVLLSSCDSSVKKFFPRRIFYGWF